MSGYTAPPPYQQYPPQAYGPPPRRTNKAVLVLSLALPVALLLGIGGGFGLSRATASAPIIGNDDCKVALEYSQKMLLISMDAFTAQGEENIYAMQSSLDDLKRLQDRMDRETGTDQINDLVGRCDKELAN